MLKETVLCLFQMCSAYWSHRGHTVVAVQMHVVLFWDPWFILITSFKALEDLSSHHFVEGEKKVCFDNSFFNDFMASSLWMFIG